MCLVLVGVVHRDPEGEKKLTRLLQELMPDALSVELSPWGLIWREGKAQALRQRLEEILGSFPREARNHPQVVLIREALSVPFEYTGAAQYARAKSIPLHLVDVNWVSRQELPSFEAEILTPYNLKLLIEVPGDPLESRIEAQYRRALDCLSGRKRPSEIGLKAPWKDKLGLLREMHIACRLRKLSAYYERIVHIGGWIHLVTEEDSSPSLAWLLKDLDPVRVLLGESPWITQG